MIDHSSQAQCKRFNGEVRVTLKRGQTRPRLKIVNTVAVVVAVSGPSQAGFGEPHIPVVVVAAVRTAAVVAVVAAAVDICTAHAAVGLAS